MATVTDDDGNLLAAMLPMNDDFGGCICVADDAIIFAGVDLGSTSPPQRSAAHARLRRMHQFLYSSFCWFEALGEPAEVDERIRRWRTIVNEMEAGAPQVTVLFTAFALFAARGQPLQDELWSWCSQDWGFAVPAPALVRRLQ